MVERAQLLEQERAVTESFPCLLSALLGRIFSGIRFYLGGKGNQPENGNHVLDTHTHP